MEWWSNGVMGLEFSNFEFRFSNGADAEGIAQRAHKWSGGVMGRRGIMGWMGHESSNLKFENGINLHGQEDCITQRTQRTRRRQTEPRITRKD